MSTAIRSVSIVAAFTLAITAFADRCLAGGSACVTDSGNQTRVCVEWSQGPNPEPNVDFVVDVQTDPQNPAIELKTGDLGWVVYAEKISDSSPANIGALTINPNTSTQNYVVKLAKGTGPGAANVGTINLNAASWSGHSSLADGSHIAGDLTGNLTVVRSGTSGGEANLVVGTIAAESTVTVPVLRGLNVETLAGRVVVTEKVDQGTIDIGTLATGAFLDIADMFGGVVRVSDAYAGEALFGSGLDEYSTVQILSYMRGHIRFFQPILGRVELMRGGDGVIGLLSNATVAKGAVVTLSTAGGPGGEPGSWDGTAEFGSLEEGGVVQTTGGRMTGTLRFDGAVEGSIVFEDTDVQFPAAVWIIAVTTLGLNDGSLGGEIRVKDGRPNAPEVHLEVGIWGSILYGGKINIGGPLTAGIISVGQGVDGDIAIGGSLYVPIDIGARLGSNGRILIDGSLVSGLLIHGGTDNTSLIRIRKGMFLGDIAINLVGTAPQTTGGPIYIGEDEPGHPVSLTYERIRINCSMDPEFGSWPGTITIVGCFRFDQTLNICYGVPHPEPTIIQTGCQEQHNITI